MTTKTNKAATKAVIRNLHKWYSDGVNAAGWQSGEVADHLSADSVESFRDDALTYLRDRSELRKTTLDSADWREVYGHFHDVEPEPAPVVVERPPAVEQQHAPGALIGYARVSTKDQDVQLQRDALNAAGCIKIFEDTASGKSADGRPELAACLEYLRAGDVFTVWKLDRVFRSTVEMIKFVDGLTERGVGFKVLTGALSSIDTTTADGRLFLTIIAGMAEFERALIRERTRAGLDSARAEGRIGGRPSVITDDVLAATLARKAKGETVPNIARALGVSKSALYRALAADAE